MTVLNTTHFNFVAVKKEVPSAQDWSAVYWNWINLDAILYSATAGHKHDGAIGLDSPTGTLVATGYNTGGYLQGGTTYFISATYVDDVGMETGKSNIVTLTPGEAITKPDVPSYDPGTTDFAIHTPNGLAGGAYWYKLAYLKDGGETEASDPVYIYIPSTTTYQVTIRFDSLTDVGNDATSIRVYRKIGNLNSYNKLIDITDADAESYTDDNSASSRCDINPKTVNTTGSYCSINIGFSGLDWVNATKIRLYATNVVYTGSPVWNNGNLLITEIDISLSTPVTSYLWTGLESLSIGQPPDASRSFGSPSKVQLTGGAEIQGHLPWENLPEDLLWKAPVATYSALPVGEAGEARVVLDEATIYIWDVTSATPYWKLVSGSGGISVYTYPDSPGAFADGEMCAVQYEENGVYYLLVGQPSPYTMATVAYTFEVGDDSGYYGEWESGMDESVPGYGYGAVRFNWDSKKLEYWDDTTATPAWVEIV